MSATITAVLRTLKAREAYAYGYADSDTTRTVGLHSAEQVRAIVTRVLGMHPDLVGTAYPYGVEFTSAQAEARWTFTTVR